MSKNYTDEEFIAIVKESVSIRQALEKLGLKPAGGNYKSFHNKVKSLNLDISHFTGQGWNKGKTLGPKRNIEEYLTNKHPIQSYKLKNRLLSEGYFEHKCYKCDLTEWNNEPIPIELEHIDGNNSNNNLDNLTILCPNCHAQTSTYRGKNIKTPKV